VNHRTTLSLSAVLVLALTLMFERRVAPHRL
jgi:hypothetical protein